MNEVLESFLKDEHFQSSMAKTLDFLTQICQQLAADRGFAEDHEQVRSHLQAIDTPAHLIQWFEDAALQAEVGRIMSEGGEAIEAIRKPRSDPHLPEFDNLTIELADIIIRVGDCAGRRELPLGSAIVAKLLFNLTRPYKHGKKS